MKNMGMIDRLIRLGVVIAIAVAWYMGVIGGIAATVLIVVAAILLLTSLVSFCPLYRILGISSVRGS